MAVAIKKLATRSTQGYKEWQAEVNFLGNLIHANVVKLLGYCWEDQALLLVYEYMPKGSLDKYLFKKDVTEPLSWSTRLNIMIGAARGLAFMHSLKAQLIFRDFKTHNILLDADFNAKLSDFGLARIFDPITGDATHVSTAVVGTYGYAAPEYIATGHVSVKSDLYGFGVVLLEVLTGQQVLDRNRPAARRNLVNWVKPLLTKKKRLKEIIDPRLGHDFPLEGAFEAAALVQKCLQLDPKARPSMNEVLETL